MVKKSGDDIDMVKRIDAYIKGNLSEDQVEDLWRDLLKNPAYIDYLETEIGVKGIIESKLRNKSTRDTGRSGSGRDKSFKYYARAIAAAAVLGVLLTFGYFYIFQSGPSPAEMAMARIELADNLITPDVVRSGDQDVMKDTDVLLRLGYEHAVAGNYDQAIEQYRKVIDNAESPEIAAKGYLNLGMVLYNSESYRQAETSFLEAINTQSVQNTIMEKAYWYLAHTYLRLDNRDQARSTLTSVSDMNGFYKEQADKILKELEE